MSVFIQGLLEVLAGDGFLLRFISNNVLVLSTSHLTENSFVPVTKSKREFVFSFCPSVVPLLLFIFIGIKKFNYKMYWRYGNAVTPVGWRTSSLQFVCRKFSLCFMYWASTPSEVPTREWPLFKIFWRFFGRYYGEAALWPWCNHGNAPYCVTLIDWLL
jgi:hypothetical protein